MRGGRASDTDGPTNELILDIFTQSTHRKTAGGCLVDCLVVKVLRPGYKCWLVELYVLATSMVNIRIGTDSNE